MNHSEAAAAAGQVLPVVLEKRPLLRCEPDYGALVCLTCNNGFPRNRIVRHLNARHGLTIDLCGRSCHRSRPDTHVIMCGVFEDHVNVAANQRFALASISKQDLPLPAVRGGPDLPLQSSSSSSSSRIARFRLDLHMRE